MQVALKKIITAKCNKPAAVIILIPLLCLNLTSCFHQSRYDHEISRIIDPYVFSITSWQITAISQEFDDWLFGEDIDAVEGTLIVREYFNNVEQKNNLLRTIIMVRDGLIDVDLNLLEKQLEAVNNRNIEILPVVEETLSLQIQSVLKEEGIINPSKTLSSFDFIFPPVSFIIQQPPHLLVVSPRDEINRLRDITLIQGLSDKEKEAIEEEIRQLGLSALVVRLGGIATFPAFVAERASIKGTLEIAIEEWFHQYLFFKPLGFLYGLHVTGLIQDYEIATINEAFAGIVSHEIAGKVYQKYYQQSAPSENHASPSPGKEEQQSFDFHSQMRQIRLKVDEYLAEGKVDEAEEYMEEKRLYMASHGYVIRKLNQAFFAFHGTYAASPISVSPIGPGLRELRGESAMLKDFVEKVSQMTDSEEIIKAAPEVN